MSRRCFGRSCRIRKRAEYDRVFRVGRSRHSAHFRVIVAESTNEQRRLGLVVSKKVGKAHDRNLVKRRIREFFRENCRLLTRPVEIVVLAKPGAAVVTTRCTWQELHQSLEDWLQPSRSLY